MKKKNVVSVADQMMNSIQNRKLVLLCHNYRLHIFSFPIYRNILQNTQNKKNFLINSIKYYIVSHTHGRPTDGAIYNILYKSKLDHNVSAAVYNVIFKTFPCHRYLNKNIISISNNK